MKKLSTGTMLALAFVATGVVSAHAQQPAPRQAPPGAPQPPAEGQPRMQGPPGMGGPGGAGFAVGVFNPSLLLERRDVLNLTPDQVTRLSGLENDLKAAREKAQTDAKPHREELQKLLQQTAPDVAQVRTHAQALMQVEQGAQLNTLVTSVQAKAVLTPEQRGRVQGWADGGGRGMGPGRGMRPRMGGPGMGGPGMGGQPGDPPQGLRMRRGSRRI
ncbi:MAG: hypothetical protein EXR93_03480 [Gemmatimonadetes bacterium]|nr:hypothetical protein [Gemmatimonadota bacterium]